MDSLSKSEEAFLEALGKIQAYWANSAADAASLPGQDLIWTEDPVAFQRVAQAINAAGLAPELRSVFSEVITGVLHSVLVCIDGGANHPGTDVLQLSGEGGVAFRRHLHEYFFTHVTLAPSNT